MLAETKNSLANAERTILECQEKIIGAVRTESDCKERIKSLTTCEERTTKEFECEFDKLICMDGVENVHVTEDRVEVFTSHVYIKHRKTTYDIGKFRIDISLSGVLRVHNLTQKITTDQYTLYHPHVKSDGQCCLGNIGPGVAKLIAEYQFAVVTQILIQFLQTYNPDNPYGKIEWWPKSKQEA